MHSLRVHVVAAHSRTPTHMREVPLAVLGPPAQEPEVTDIMSLIAWADSVDWSPCPREHRGSCSLSQTAPPIRRGFLRALTAILHLPEIPPL